jgi:hypothetical protein
MTNSVPQSPLNMVTPGGGASRTQEQLVSQQQRKKQRQSDDHQEPPIAFMSRLQLQEEDENKDDEDMMMSSSRRILQWQEQQEHCPEFAAQWIAPAQKESSQYNIANAIRRSSFHYNLHSKLHGLFQDDDEYLTNNTTNKLSEQRL